KGLPARRIKQRQREASEGVNVNRGFVKAVLLASSLVLVGSNAHALAVGDTNYLGFVDPGSPANAAAEAEYINALLTLDPGEIVTPNNCLPTQGGNMYTCNRESSTI